MQRFRQRWFVIGLVPAGALALLLLVDHRALSGRRIMLCLSLIALLLHQFEEYRLPGTFPRMVNTAMFRSSDPARYPLNANTACLINVGLGWLVYGAAIVLGAHAIWLATASIVVSAGNVVAHALVFNVRGRTIYNAGLATSILLFLPLVVAYVVYLDRHGLLHAASLAGGVASGVVLAYVGVYRMIAILGDTSSPYPFIPLR